ncbi:MAG: c-type cytochrome biogenesis protein CcsB [Elusimicrobiales bacterium]|nr:c-type cytochrome biogenesis protein CcsB [Elusimicrobiales bacterium]
MELAQKASFVFYAAALAAALTGFLLNKDWKFKYSILALLGGLLCTTYHIGARWYWAGRAPLSNMYESLTFMVWAFVGVYLLFRKVSGRALDWLAPWTALVAVLTLGGASFFDSDIEPLMPALQSNWLLIHVSTVMTGYGALLLSFVGAAIFSFMGPQQEEKKQSLESLVYRACLVGFWLLSLGIITGAVWANSAWGSYWSWDPKETWSLITWLYYALAIHLRRTRGWRDKKFAGLMLWGFVLVMFTYFGVNYLLSGLHSYGKQ